MPLRQDEKEEVLAIVKVELAKALPKKEAIKIPPVVKKQEKSKEIKKNT